MKIANNLESYECQPQLVFSEWNEAGKKIDSDIQNIYDSLDFSNLKNNLDLKEQFTFIKNLDQHDNDVYYHKKSLEEQMTIALKDDKCVGFNTLGFFKNKIDLDNLKPSPYFGENDGIYIKKEYLKEGKNNNNKNIRVKMLCNWCSSEQLCKEWSNMCEKGFVWKNIELVWTDVKEEIDYYVIINSCSKDEYFEPLKTIVFQMEPWVNDATKNWGVKTWNKWSQPDNELFLAVRGRKTHHHNNAFWQLELTHNELLNLKVEKTKIISSICSSKYFDEGHIARIDLLKYIEQKNDPNVIIDIYNQDNHHNFKNFKGPVSPYVDKSKGYKPYKYYFMIENNYEENFITEKLWEPILCESLCFYYGCPNVTDYIDSRAFVLLDINDFENSYQIIKKAIEEDLWSQRIDIIRQEKQRILNELAFFPTIEKIIIKTQKNEEIKNEEIKNEEIKNEEIKNEKIKNEEIKNEKIKNEEIKNEEFEKYFGNNTTESKKYCFIHSCYLKESGTDILTDIVSNIINSGLIQHLEKIFIVNIGENLERNMFSQEKIVIINYSDNYKLYEIPTINLIHTFCEHNDNCEILYLHTKGTTFYNNPNKQYITDWRNLMLYFLVEKYSDCFELLQNYDATGCNYITAPCKHHFSGNFWWANSNYIKQLKRLPDICDRHESEWWILSNKSVNSYEIHNSLTNHYHDFYPKDKYIS
jgi:hypothetical protein